MNECYINIGRYIVWKLNVPKKLYINKLTKSSNTELILIKMYNFNKPSDIDQWRKVNWT